MDEMQIWRKKPLEEPFLALDPRKTNLLELQKVSKEMSTKINPTKYFVESYQSTHNEDRNTSTYKSLHKILCGELPS